MIVFRRNIEHLNNVIKSTQFLPNRKQKLEDILKQQFLVERSLSKIFLYSNHFWNSIK
jgi:hypothetical protein